MENKKLSRKSPAVSIGNHREKYVSTKFHLFKTKTKKQQQHEKRKGKKRGKCSGKRCAEKTASLTRYAWFFLAPEDVMVSTPPNGLSCLRSCQTNGDST